MSHDDDKVKVGALWKKDGPKGTFYTGTVEPTAIRNAVLEGKDRLLVFVNGYKDSENHPDLIVYLATGHAAQRKTHAQQRHVRDEDVNTNEPTVARASAPPDPEFPF